MWRDQSDRLVCNQHYISTLRRGVSHFSRDYETFIFYKPGTIMSDEGDNYDNCNNLIAYLLHA